MEPATRKFARFDTPHPAVTIGGVLVLLLLALMRFRWGLLSGDMFLVIVIVFMMSFSILSRRSARRMRERRR
ncbi:MAG TPA: hypothetical protein VKO66_08595, partial [Sideroxyarcus sp.]|nr:hypothetical protein [Sideroxyarcus sp.]